MLLAARCVRAGCQARPKLPNSCQQQTAQFGWACSSTSTAPAGHVAQDSDCIGSYPPFFSLTTSYLAHGLLIDRLIELI